VALLGHLLNGSWWADIDMAGVGGGLILAIALISVMTLFHWSEVGRCH